MGIIFNKVNNNINFNIEDANIYSFIGDSKSIKSLIGEYIVNPKLCKNGKVIISENIKIGYVNNNPYNYFKNLSVEKLLESILKKNKYKKDKIDTRINEVLNIVNLDKKYLNTIDNDLDYVNAKKLSFACALIFNPNVIVLDNYTECLNNSDRKELMRLIKMLKNRYNKILILLTKDTSFCYEVGGYVYLVNDSEIVKKGTYEIIRNTSLINRLNLRVPPIIKFIKEYKKNNDEFNDYNNTLDLIKGIYRDIGYRGDK